MAETSVKNRFCDACGVDVRPGSLFCYNCGCSVAPNLVRSDNQNSKELNQVRFRENITEKNNLQTTKLDVEVNEQFRAQKKEDKPIPKPEIKEINNFQTAPRMRRKTKILQRRIIEVAWEEADNKPNIYFIAASLLLTVFVLIILFVAMYLK